VFWLIEVWEENIYNIMVYLSWTCFAWKYYCACVWLFVRACKKICKLIVKNIMYVAPHSNPSILENTSRCVSMREKKDRPWTWTVLRVRARTNIYIVKKTYTIIFPLILLNKCVLTNWGARRKYLQHNGLPFLNMFCMKMLLCLHVAFC
jgi:hypothetical protein